MDPNIRATGMGMSSGRPPRSSGSEDSDEGRVVDGMMHRAMTGNIDSEDMDDVGPSRMKRRKKKNNNNNNNKKAYTGRPRVPYQMPDDDEPEPEQPPPQPEVEKEVEQQPQQVPMGPVNSACPEYYATHMSWPLPEGYEDARVGRADGACKEPLCVARRPWFRRSEYEDHDTEYYDTKSMADALVDCTMGEGTKYDLTPRNQKSLKIFTLGKVGVTMERVSPSWGFLRPQVIKSEFYLSCIKGGRVSLDVEKYIPDALRAYESKYGLTKEELAHAFTVVHMGAPNGVIVQVRAMFDGKMFHGKEIPEDLKSLLRNEGVRKMGFGVTKDVELLRAAGVEVESVCDLHSVVLMLWPQWELHQPKTSKWYVKEMLRAPCPIYTYGQERPLGGMKLNYNKMDFALPVDLWDPLWSYYNAMDHGLAFAIMDYASARAADLDNLNMSADVVRYTLDILDAIRDLPADPMGARRHKSCDRFKLETDEDRGKQKFWPITTDYDMYVRFRDRVDYKERVPQKHKPDREQFEEEYLGDLESRVGAKVENWNNESRAGNAFGLAEAARITFPHACAKCGSFYHAVDQCTSTESCVYPLCQSEAHAIVVCPMLHGRCDTCSALGHSNHQGLSTMVLAENFNAARRVHLIASRLRDADVAYTLKMSREAGFLELVEEVAPPVEVEDL
jgi:hypothetical protein